MTLWCVGWGWRRFVVGKGGKSVAPSERALEAHSQACSRGEDGYMDPDTGRFVMTSRYLRRRGECCGNGCRHCPWPAEVQAQAGRGEGLPAWPLESS